MRSKIQAALGLAAILMAGACSPTTAPVRLDALEPPVFGPSDSVFTDRELLAAAYTTFAGPPGFYADPSSPDAPPFYVSSLSVGSSVTQSVELSTEDAAQARQWAVLSFPRSTVDPGPPTVTFRYFEFAAYESDDGLRRPVRVHRASYLDRSGFDRFRVGEVNMVIGALKARPVEDTAVRGVAEYLWALSNRNSRIKVLTSFSRASQGSFVHTIFFVHRVPAVNPAHSGPAEAVILKRCDYRVDSETGEIQFRQTGLQMVPSVY